MKDDEKKFSVIITKSEYAKLEELADDDVRNVSGIVRVLIKKLISGEITIVTSVKQKID